MNNYDYLGDESPLFSAGGGPKGAPSGREHTTASSPYQARQQWLLSQYRAGMLTWSELCALRDAPMYLP